MKKRLVAVLLVAAMSMSLLTACRDSGENKATVDIEQTDYDPEEEVKNFEFGDLTDEEKNYTIEMGYNNCDHMVAAIIGEKAGIYKALGLNVNVTKSGETVKALISGAMDTGYIGVGASALSQNPPYFIASANHTGGSRYLVVSNDITEPSQIEGKTLAMTSTPEGSAEWRAWARDYDVSFNAEDYNIVSMGQQDAMFALKAGQIDGFVCCDPYASIAEFEGFGHIMFTSWGINMPKDGSLPESDDWARCCALAMNKDFAEKHPELARRLVYAHMLSIKYLYEHPYNASMMFADGFDCDPYVGLRTVYMKTVAEGRTITWHWSKANLQNDEDFDTQFTNPSITETDISYVSIFEDSLKRATELADSAGLDDFDTYIEEKVDPISPLGITFEDWYDHAKTIDGISDEDAVDISKTATPYLNENVKGTDKK